MSQTAKIIHIIIMKHLLKRLNSVGIPYEFSHDGCQEALHCLRSALTLRKHHGLKSYILFIDLVKAFDLIQHKVLYKILQKYGLPESLVDIVNKLYNSCYIQQNHGINTL